MNKAMILLVSLSVLAIAFVAINRPAPATATLDPGDLLKVHDTGSPFTLTYNWTKNWGDASGDASAVDMAVDRWGNLYVSGQFSGTVNFDPAGADSSATVTSSNHTVDAYLVKLDANGHYQWAKTWGTSAGACGGPASRGCGREAANSVVVDASGDAYVAGLFQNTVNFGNGHTAISNAPNGSNNIFFTKFAADGTNQWVRAWGGATGGEAYSLALDATRGYAYVQGDWSTNPPTGTVDFNPGGPDGQRANHGFFDAFLVKYDLNGNFQWVRTWGGSQYDDGTGVAVDEATGNVYVCGMYGSQDINFDPAGTSAGLGHPSSDNNLVLVDVFFTAFDADGNWRWVRTWGGPGYVDAGSAPAVDHAGNVYAIARFGCQSCNFKVGANGPITPGIVYTASGPFDMAISKFDANGNYLWSQARGGPLIDQPTSLVVDEANNVYVAGMVERIVGGTLFNQVITSTTAFSKFSADGTFQWEKTWGGTGDDSPGGIALDGADNLYIPGQFQHTIDFNPGSGVDNIPARGVLDASLTQYLAETPITAMAGGVVTVTTGVTTIMTFPTTVAPITITENLTNTQPVSGNLTVLGLAIIVHATDVTGTAVVNLTSPFTVTIHYTPADGARFDGYTLQVYYWDAQTSAWQAIDTTVDTTMRTLTAQTSRLGMLAVFGEEGAKVFLPLIKR